MTDDADIRDHPSEGVLEHMRKKIQKESDKMVKSFISPKKPDIEIIDKRPKETCHLGVDKLEGGDPKLSELMADENSYIHEHLETLRMLTILTRPNSILEIGTGRGDSTLAFAEGLAQIGKGHIITLDIKSSFQAHDLILDQDLSTFVTFLKMSSNDYIKKLEGVQSIDILFIDGLHTYKQVKMELHLLCHYIADEGMIILHDTNNPAHPGVYKAVQEFLADKYLDYKFFEYYNCNGLTVLQHDIPDG